LIGIGAVRSSGVRIRMIKIEREVIPNTTYEIDYNICKLFGSNQL
jgi:hypothetical protein